MSTMTQKQILTILEPWLEAFLNIETALADFEKLCPIADLDNCPLWRNYYQLFDLYTAQIAINIGGDKEGWLSWFIYDNDAGAKGYPATHNAKTHPARPIRTLKDLAKLLHLSLPTLDS